MESIFLVLVTPKTLTGSVSFRNLMQVSLNKKKKKKKKKEKKTLVCKLPWPDCFKDNWRCDNE